MPQQTLWHQVLWNKLGPSIQLQARGSQNIPIRSSSTFGPQINSLKFQDFGHKQVGRLVDQLNKMNQ